MALKFIHILSIKRFAKQIKMESLVEENINWKFCEPLTAFIMISLMLLSALLSTYLIFPLGPTLTLFPWPSS